MKLVPRSVLMLLRAQMTKLVRVTVVSKHRHLHSRSKHHLLQLIDLSTRGSTLHLSSSTPMRRSALWKDVHAFSDYNSEYERKETIIPGPPKTNLPKTQPSRGLEKFLDSVEEGILSAPIKPYKSNIPRDEEAAMANIVDAQRRRIITLKS